MGKNLVIVESPAKAKTINKILGKDFIVKASMGHVRDLPQKKLGVDIENDFTPEYVTLKGRQKIVQELTQAAKGVDGVYLAPDPDREGEAIAWHLVEALKKKLSPDQFFRVTYNEITAPAIRHAFSNPSEIDNKKVDAQQARRVLDRIVGYKVSPLLWRRIKGGSSAGRVQSVALRLVCEREQEIESFVPKEYWLLGANTCKQVDHRDPFEIRLVKIDGENPEIGSAEQAEHIEKDLEGRTLKVSEIKLREISKKARAPYITSTLQQAASTLLGYNPSRTMSIAQRLYEGLDGVGLITYMRTDSVSIAKEAQGACLKFVEETFGNEYVPGKPNFFKSKSSAQEAHEAIRPTDVGRTPEALKSVLQPEELKLYKIIWERFVASQMAPARIAQRSVDIDAISTEEKKDKTSYLFRVSTSDILFPGYMKVAGVEKSKSKKSEDGNIDEEGHQTDKIPPLTEGETLDCLEWLKEQKFTQPPPRYTEASLVRTLEENRVGRPSTYAQTIATLNQREYVEREKRALKPTESGKQVNEFLVKNLDALFNVGFTAGMEEALDGIEKGTINWTQMLKDFYADFSGWVDKAKGLPADPETVQKILTISEEIKEWSPPTKRGKRTYSDETFAQSIEKRLKEEKEISMRQLDALKKMICQYKGQLPELEQRAEELGITEELREASIPKDPPRDETVRKLDLLKDIHFAEPKKVGKRTYDDKAFSESLRQQVESGKRLSVNQIRYLDQLFMKYAGQIENFETVSKELCLNTEPAEEDKKNGPVLDLFNYVEKWFPPLQRGKRTWDDKEFFESLKQQFKAKKTLSPRQLSALRKMAKRYADQIPNFDEIREQYGLPERGKPKEKKPEETKAE